MRVNTTRLTRAGRLIGGKNRSRCRGFGNAAQLKMAEAAKAEQTMVIDVLDLYKHQVKLSDIDDCPRGRALFDAMVSGHWYQKDQSYLRYLEINGCDSPELEPVDREKRLARLPDTIYHDELEAIHKQRIAIGAPMAWRNHSSSLVFA